jgi:fructose-1,6-bisphosphatase/inositol monophosphatase family enzyme
VEIERALISRLQELFPDWGLWVEEHEEVNDASQEYTWYVDPIDGSKYFRAQIPLCSISVGLCRGDEPVLGIVFQPVTNQMYVGGPDLPTTLNKQSVRVNHKRRLSEAVLSVDFVLQTARSDVEKQWILDKQQQLHEQSYRCRVLGQGALSCAYVASGGLDALVVLNGWQDIKPLDFAAGRAVVLGAGGVEQWVEVVGFDSPRLVCGVESVVEMISEAVRR